MTELCLPQTAQPLKLWERIELVIGEGAGAGHYVSRIEDFVEDGIMVNKPEMISGSARLRDGAEITVFVTKEDAVYEFCCRVRKSNDDRFFLTMPDSVRRVQRRRFVRIDISQDVLYALVPSPNNPVGMGAFLKWRTAHGINLSGGGILLRTTREISRDGIALLKVPVFHELRLPEFVATVCRRVTADKDQFLCGMEFIDVNTTTRHFSPKYLKILPPAVREFNHRSQAVLVDYVFKYQISLRRKGLL